MKLSEEELLNVYPQSGTFVSKIDLEHVEEARFVREQIETSIVRLVCEHIPDENIFKLEANITMQKLSGGGHEKAGRLHCARRLEFGHGERRWLREGYFV